MTQINDHLYVLWTSADREVALNMAFMYTTNARRRKWWDAVTLIVWGPSARLLAEDAELGERIEEMKAVGVELLACRACADNYGVSDRLMQLGIEVIYMGEPLTRILKDGHRLLTI